MEADSQISGNKTFENKSFLSFRYIYKKVILKETMETSKSELRAIDYEKIAKYKMKNMNIKFLLNSILKLKNSINKNNPLLKYIKNVKPYDYPNIKINLSANGPIIEFLNNKKINIVPKQKEKILNFSANINNFKNFYYSRMFNIEYKKINHNRNEKIILIQKHVRGFLSKKIVDEEINKIIAKKIIQKILIIQKAIRHFLNKKNTISHLIVNIIQNERISKSNKITDIFSLYHFRNLYKKNLIIQKIIKARNKSIKLIQSKFKSYMFIKKIREIIKKEKNSYVLTYPFPAESVQIKIYLDNSYKIYDFFICPIRKYFILYIEKGTIIGSEYLCHMIVNNNIILDKRYKYIVDKNNILYNLIYIGEPIIKKPKLDINKIENEIKNDTNEKKVKKEKREKKIKKKENKNIIEDTDNDFFYYCYNENSNSTNSYSTKSEHEKNKLQSEKKEEIFLNNIHKQKINELKLKIKNREKIPKSLPTDKYNNTRNKIFMKNYDFRTGTKNIKSNEKNSNNKTYLYDNYNSKNEGSIQSQKIKYINILDELSQTLSSSSSRSNFSMKNINFYSKKTHQTKFCSNHNIKNSSNKVALESSNYNNNKIINTSNRNKSFK